MIVEVSLDLIDCDPRSYTEAVQDNKGKGRSTLSLDAAPPVKLRCTGSRYFCADGCHRIARARELKRLHIRAVILP